MYGNCLANALYAVFLEAFPESERHFGDEFKEYLVNNVHEWVSGLCEQLVLLSTCESSDVKR